MIYKIIHFSYFRADNNETLKPTYEVSKQFMEQKIKELALQYNYTLNPKGVYEAIKFMYTYWPDPDCKVCLRNEFINVSMLPRLKIPDERIDLSRICICRCYRISCMWHRTTKLSNYCWSKTFPSICTCRTPPSSLSDCQNGPKHITISNIFSWLVHHF